MVCLFTEGVVTNVEPFWMALVTLLAALCCCQEKGLPRCVWLLRFPLLVLALLLLADLLTKAQLDFLHPISGAGDAVNQRLFLSQNALGWPLLLFAELPPGREAAGNRPPAAAGAFPADAVCGGAGAAHRISHDREKSGGRDAAPVGVSYAHQSAAGVGGLDGGLAVGAGDFPAPGDKLASCIGQAAPLTGPFMPGWRCCY